MKNNRQVKDLVKKYMKPGRTVRQIYNKVRKTCTTVTLDQIKDIYISLLDQN